MLSECSRLDRHHRAVHGWEMKHDVKLPSRARRRVAPGIRALGIRVLLASTP
jgi:hypothetical protein